MGARENFRELRFFARFFRLSGSRSFKGSSRASLWKTLSQEDTDGVTAVGDDVDDVDDSEAGDSGGNGESDAAF